MPASAIHPHSHCLANTLWQCAWQCTAVRPCICVQLLTSSPGCPLKSRTGGKQVAVTTQVAVRITVSAVNVSAQATLSQVLGHLLLLMGLCLHETMVAYATF